MSANFGSDPWLDARLRNVPLPVGMLARLSQVGVPTDEQLDAVVRDVPLPDGFCQRLQQIADLPQRRFDWAPADWPAVAWTRRHVGWREVAIAASLLLAVGAGYLAVASRLAGGRPGSDRHEDLLATHDTAVSASGSDQETVPDDLLVDSSDSAPASGDDPSGDSPGSGDSLFPPIDFKPLPLPGPRARRPRNLLFASDGAIDRLPPLETVSPSADRGLAPPLVASYDLLSHLKTGERSFAAPSADPQLAWTMIPLKQDTSSYRLAQRCVGSGRLPSPEDVRIEDFLTAQNDHYPAADGPLVIRVAAGPSPLGEPGLRLLQVGVQAGRIVTAARAATDLTIAVDTSASMRHGRRLEMVRAAMRRLVGELTPADRVTLIGFSDDAELLADRLQVDSRSKDSAERAAVDRWLTAVDHLLPENGTNVGAGIALASDAILHNPVLSNGTEPRRRQLVLLSDGLSELGPDASRQIGALLKALSSEGVKFNVLDVSGEPDVSGPLGELAAAGEGQAVRAADTDEIAAALADALAGARQTVAHSTSLKVTFNPQVVHSYRLVGHATTTITGPASASTQVDLHTARGRPDYSNCGCCQAEATTWPRPSWPGMIRPGRVRTS